MMKQIHMMTVALKMEVVQKRMKVKRKPLNKGKNLDLVYGRDVL